MKKIIFIAGTAYSGSSMLGMMLGNTEESFYTGELHSLFNPTKNYHINPKCGCGNDLCSFWQSIKKDGKRNLYENIFKYDCKVNTIVDSSKNVFWINEQIENLKNSGINIGIIIIWKKPEEFAISRFKRRELKGWERAWLNYHRLFLSTNKNWCSIKYSDLVMYPQLILEKVCKKYEIKYKQGMENFWEKKHHMLFGNTFAKYHMYEKDANQYEKMVNQLMNVEKKFDGNENIETKYRTISYDKQTQYKLSENEIRIIKSGAYKNIANILKYSDILDCSGNTVNRNEYNQIKFSRAIVEAFKIKRIAKQKIFKLTQHCVRFMRNKND